MSDQDIQRYEQMLADDPGSRVFAPLADAYRKAGRLNEAIQTARTGLRYNPHYSGGFVVLGRALFEKGELGPAGEAIQKAVEEAPENYLAQKTLAKISMTQGENARALRALQAALLLSPEDVEIQSDIESLKSKVAHPGGIDFSSEDAAQGPVAAPFPPEPEIQDLEPLPEGVGAEDSFPVPEIMIPENEFNDFSLEDVELTEEAPPEVYPETVISPEPLPEPVMKAPVLEGAAEVEDIQFPAFLDELSTLTKRQTEDIPDIDVIPEAITSLNINDADEQPSSSGTGNDIFTETLADLYARQGVSDEAAHIYEQLREENPADVGIDEKLRSVGERQLGKAAPDPTVEVKPDPPEAIAPLEDQTGSSKDPVHVLAGWLENAERMKRR